jgi:hypothetical protein
MSRLNRRVQTLRDTLPDGCPACWDRPHVWLLNDGDPEPPERCDRCGRRFTGLVRVSLKGVDVADI